MLYKNQRISVATEFYIFFSRINLDDFHRTLQQWSQNSMSFFIVLVADGIKQFRQRYTDQVLWYIYTYTNIHSSKLNITSKMSIEIFIKLFFMYMERKYKSIEIFCTHLTIKILYKTHTSISFATTFIVL